MQEIQKLYLNEMTQQKMYKIFGLRKVSKLPSLEEWLSNLPDLNEIDNKMYGCYVVGRNWFFMVLEGKEYVISKAYSADDFEELVELIRVLKSLKEKLFKKIEGTI